MKILTISNTPWSFSNSFGNSYNSLFEGISDDYEFANIYLSYGSVNTSLNMQGFQITPHNLIANLKNKKVKTGQRVNNNNSAQERNENEQNRFNKARVLRFQVLFWARDLIWKIGRWKSPELIKFIDDFKPDIIFQPIYFAGHINDIVCFVKDYTGVPMIGYISDDNYTLRQVNFSPLYWIDRLIKRRKVKKSINKCEKLYVISKFQKEEYEKIFNPPCEILTKGANFDEYKSCYDNKSDKIKMVYAGNLGDNRWRSVGYIAKAIDKINQSGNKISLDIYSGTPLTEKMKKTLSGNGTTVKKPVSYKEILEIQKNADVLIHAEGTDLKSRYAVHQSFSTKIVDYFALAKCIFAVGKPDEASIYHLITNDSAIVAQNETEVYEKLKDLCDNPDKLAEYGKKAWDCGMKNHQKSEIQAMIKNDIERAVDR